MSFLHPALAAAGLACVAIPIIIHFLLRRRRKPVQWGAMRFLLEAYRQQRSRLRLEQILLLLVRCLVVALLAAAIARPLVQAADALGAGSARSVYILIDNSLASKLRRDDATALDAHKRAAAGILDALAASDRAAVITLGSPADALVVPPSSDAASLKSVVERVEATDGAADFAGALQRVAADLGDAPSRAAQRVQIVLLSDFLLGSADMARPLPLVFERTPDVAVFLSSALESAPTNVQVSAIEPLRPVLLTGDEASLGGGQVRVTLRRSGPGVSEAGSTIVRLRFDDERASALVQPSQAQVRWAPGQSEATVMMQAPLGAGVDARRGAAMLLAEIDRDALEADNIRRRPLPARDAISVGVVSRRAFGAPATIDRLLPADWLRLALRPTDASPIELVDVEPTAIDAPTLAALDAVFIPRPDLVTDDGWLRVRRFADAGGLVVVFPPADTRVHLWPDAMASAMGLDWRIARESVEPGARTLAQDAPATELFAMISGELADLVRPIEVLRTLPLEQTPVGLRPLLSLADGAPWVVAQAPGGREDASSDDGVGLVVYVASSPTLSWTNLPAMPLMVPLMQELVRQGVGGGLGAAAVAGSSPLAPMRSVELRSIVEGVSRTYAVDRDGRVSSPLREAGVYAALDEGGQQRGVIAVNPDADAGRTDVQARSAIESWLAGAGVPAAQVRWLERDGGEQGGDGRGALGASGRDAGVSFPLLLGAMALALLEVVMARFFSHARRGAPPESAIDATPPEASS